MITRNSRWSLYFVQCTCTSPRLKLTERELEDRSPPSPLCFMSLNTKNMMRQIQMQIPDTDQNHVWEKLLIPRENNKKINMVCSAMLLTWRDGPLLSQSGWGRNRGVDEGLLLVHSPEAVNTNRQRGWRSKRNTKHWVLTAPELGRVVKVGEERVKLVRTEERVAAGLRAAGSSYVRDHGSVDIGRRRV